jgi:hypothetical protein
MRRMSFALTTDAVRNRKKTVTRRIGWTFLKPGERLLAVDKIRVKNAEKLAVIEVVDVRRESLFDMHESDVAREGFDMFERCDSRPSGPHEDFPSVDCTSCFFEMFIEANPAWEERERLTRGNYEVTRVEFRYVDESQVSL